MLDSFQELLEGTQLHLMHIEDTVFFGLAQTTSTLSALRGIVEKLNSGGNSKIKLTTKFDGSPVIIAGIDPVTHQFFMGGKSAANPNGNRFFSVQDIKAHISDKPDVQAIFIKAFNALSKMRFSNILVGDVLFFDDTIRLVSSPEVGEVVAFTPNALTYTAPVDSPMGKQILKSDFGIVWHTELIQSRNGSVSKKPIRNTSQLPTGNPRVWQRTPEIQGLFGKSLFTNKEAKGLINSLASIEKLVKKYSGHIQESVWSNPLVGLLLEKFATFNIKSTGALKLTYPGFLAFATKEAVGRWKTSDRINGFIESVTNARKEIEVLFLVHSSVHSIKQQVIEKLNTLIDMDSFMESEPGVLTAKASEGFVAIDAGDNLIKLVDRINFSAFNFQQNQQSLSEELLQEGGNAVPGVSRINQENVPDTLADIRLLLGSLGFRPQEIGTLGSTNKKLPGQSSGDLDINLDSTRIIKEKEIELDDLVSELANTLKKSGYQVKSSKGFNLVSFGFPINASKDKFQRGKTVQVDLFANTNFKWTEFAYRSPHASESKYGAMPMQRLLYAIAALANLKVLESKNKEPITIQKYIIHPQEGLVQQTRTKRQKSGSIGPNFNVVLASKTVTKDPNQIARILLGPGFTRDDMTSFEKLLAAIESPKFVNKSKLKDIKERAFQDILDTDGVSIPELA